MAPGRQRYAGGRVRRIRNVEAANSRADITATPWGWGARAQYLREVILVANLEACERDTFS